ncbi:MAG TPA: leucyl aminopeptidase family protein [Steroidobacteraceae bacterium]|nr:leucyl aminopeptidase family protein [Steroidobacteraceae bacterium]
MTAPDILVADGADARPLWLVNEAELPSWLESQPQAVANWLRCQGFQGERHRVVALPAADGTVAGAVLGLGCLRSAADVTLWHAAGLPERLPAGVWRLATALEPAAATQFLLGFLTGAYRLHRYRSTPPAPRVTLAVPAGADVVYARAAAAASNLARDLVNTPANDLGPAELAQAALELAQRHGARCQVLTGADLLAHGYPLIHAVGAGSPRAPRLVDLRWGRAGAPRVTLVGKGVCFDSGGLDIKPGAAMLLMKKDMGGGACALALAGMLMELAAPIQLRLLLPCVENSVDGLSYRPGDVLRSRKGLTVEIGNTDAEGRLVLADALAEADSERPDLLIDLATLTGAARTALGPELPAVYCADEALLGQLRQAAQAECDPLWPMPLWPGYDDEFGSKIADICNVSATAFAGSIIAALFLKRFVTATPLWVHVDLYAWNARERPGRPVGAETQCVRALYRLIRARCG